VLVIIFWMLRRLQGPALAVQPAGSGLVFGVLGDPRLAFGAVSIFAYVGAEVSIGSLLTNYLMQPSTLGLAAAKAGTLVSLYWGGAMVGRFIGSAVLRRVPAGVVLAACALGAGLLASTSALSTGMVAAVTVIAIGLCNSIMFPTIFTLAIERLGARTPQGSAMLCLAIVGGAVVPVVTGYVADHGGLATALFVPAACYLWIAVYGVLTRMGVVDRVQTQGLDPARTAA
jgi:MFS transporter, FHS family, L-fucose permease